MNLSESSFRFKPIGHVCKSSVSHFRTRIWLNSRYDSITIKMIKQTMSLFSSEADFNLKVFSILHPSYFSCINIFQGHRTKVIREGKDSISCNYLTKRLFSFYLKCPIWFSREWQTICVSIS